MSNIVVIWIPEGEEKEIGAEKMFEEMMTGAFPDLRDTNLQI